jgi:3-hydroxyacyl-CoA dehydrogenase
LELAASKVADGPRRIREMSVPDVDGDHFDETRKAVAKKTRGLISPEKIIQCVEKSTQVDFDEGCKFEREAFLECKSSTQSAGLRHAFFAERAVSKVPGIGNDTTVRELGSIAVLGAGTMGAGIAYNCLTSGFNVHLLDNDEAGLERGETTIRKLFEGGIARGKISEEKMAEGIGRLNTTTDYAGIADADLVIEAVFENLAIKKEVFEKLDAVCKDGAILATNTSTLDVDAIAGATRRPHDVIGLHFFSPAHIMRLLEIVRGAKTSSEVIATSLALAKRLRKIGVVVGNCFGFVGNRMLYSYGRENQFLLLEGAAPEHIDRALYDWGMAMGPNAVGDLAGLDVGYKVRQERTDLPDDPRFYRVADLLVEQGRFGQKTGKGMYLYADGSRNPTPDPDVQTLINRESERLGIERRAIEPQEIIERCIYGLISEGARILEDGIAARSSDIDVIWTNGYGFPRHRGGPMHYADTVGLAAVYEKICEFRDRFGAEFWEPPALLKDLADKDQAFSDFDKG